MRSNLVAGIDIGSTKTCAVIAEVIAEIGSSPIIKVLGVGQSRTGGMRREAASLDRTRYTRLVEAIEDRYGWGSAA